MPDITVLITSRVKAEIKKSINYETSVQISAENEEDDTSVEQEDYHAVILQRGTKGFGFGICGGKEFHNMPLFVLRIVDNGPAQQDGKIKIYFGCQHEFFKEDSHYLPQSGVSPGKLMRHFSNFVSLH